MTRRRSRAAAVLGVAVSLSMLSCSAMRKGPAADDPPDVQKTVALAQRSISSANHQKALELLHGAYKEHPENAPLRSAYIRAVEQTRKEADAVFATQRYQAAGALYAALLKGDFHTAGFAGELSFGMDYLKGRIRTCARILTKNGLVKYREGKLDAAIAVWEKVLAFDPGNAEVKNALGTAKAQLKNLKKLQ
ncbi:MAG: tetratricopeptide repeat protein [Nitrospirota bacterium]